MDAASGMDAKNAPTPLCKTADGFAQRPPAPSRSLKDMNEESKLRQGGQISSSRVGQISLTKPAAYVKPPRLSVLGQKDLVRVIVYDRSEIRSSRTSAWPLESALCPKSSNQLSGLSTE